MKPVRRNFAHLTQAERDAYVAAVNAIDATKAFPDGVSYWDKQDQIHQATHVHIGPSFVPWHRELLNRYEEMLQEVDPTVALHYWDWTVDPRNAPDGDGGTVDLMTSANLGSDSGRVGTPFQSLDNDGDFPGSRGDTGDPADPPQEITRNINAGAPGIASDNAIVTSGDGLPQDQQWQEFRETIESNHDSVHGYVGGDIGFAHSSFEDPFVFLLHSNVDRLWAMWQTQPGYEWRLDPAQTYGDEADTTGLKGIDSPLEPWAGGTSFPQVTPVRPWAPPENQIEVKNSKHPSIIQPPCYDTVPLSVELSTPVFGAPITFNAVPEGVTTVRAAVFDIRACTDITLEVTAGPGADFALPLGDTVVVPYSADWPFQGRVWISFTGTTAGSANNGQVTIHCPETGQDWVIDIVAHTITNPKAAGVLVLDKSGSMAWDSGIPGMTRLEVLKWAAPHYVNLMDDDDGIGIVAFDEDADPVMAVTPAGPPVFGVGRANALSAIGLHDEDNGGTAIGDGLELGHATINGVPGYDHKSLIVFTDGHETASKTISEVAGLLNQRVFAIGLGRADQLDVGTLDDLTSSTGGYLLMTGDLGVDDLFRVSKYFLQVLAGVTNSQIVVDPEATIAPGQEHRIPFQLNEADHRTDVVLLSPAPWAIEFALETPDGKIITQADAAAMAGIDYVDAFGVNFFRISLPLLIDGKPRHGGTWHAVMRMRKDNYREYAGSTARSANSALRSGVPYNLSVYARSTVALHAAVTQASHEPGAEIRLRARLSQYELPMTGGAQVRVEIDQPVGATSTLTLHQTDPGLYEGSFTATDAGVYGLRFLATGKTLAGHPFTREALRTAGVTPGGDNPPTIPTDDDPWERICELVECLLGSDRLRELLKTLGIDEKHLLACLGRICRRKPIRTIAAQPVNPKLVGTLTDLLGRRDVRKVLTQRE